MTSLADTLIALKPIHTGIQLIRIGGNQDGAYLCPNDLEGITKCISPGGSNRKLFEDDLWNNFGISSVIVDKSSSPEGFTTPMHPGQRLIQKWLVPFDTDKGICIQSLLNSSLVNSTGDLLLQMDIEGAEYQNLASWSDEIFDRFRIVVIELHSLELIMLPWRKNSRLIRKAIKKLTLNHVCIHSHPNNCCGSFIVPGTSIEIPRVLECTFLRRDRLQGTNHKIRSQESHIGEFPHPLDVVNHPEKPNLVLNKIWILPDCYFKNELHKARFKRYVFMAQWIVGDMIRKLRGEGSHPLATALKSRSKV